MMSRSPSRIALSPVITVSLLAVFATLSLLAQAEVGPASEAEPGKVNLSNTASRTVQKVLGLNALSAWIATGFLNRQLGKQFEGPIKSRIIPYSAGDLISGKVYGVEITGNKLVYKDALPIHYLSVQTLRETPIYIERHANPPHLIQPVDATVTMTVTLAELNQFFQKSNNQESFRQIKLKLPPLGEQSLDLIQPHIEFKENAIYFTGKLNVTHSPPENALPVKGKARLVYDAPNQTFRLKDLDLEAEGISDLGPLAHSIESHFGKVLRFNKLKFKTHKVTLDFEPPIFTPDQLTVKGKARIAPKTPPTPAARAGQNPIQ